MGRICERLLACLLLASVLFLPAPAWAAPGTGDSEDTHVVKSGETLDDIADQYGVTVTGILVANGMDGPSDLKVGMKLTIPLPEAKDAKPTEYEVVKGDTLASVAAEFGVTIADLAVANDMLVTDDLEVGQVLVIPEATTPTDESPDRASEELVCLYYHQVEKGDTLTRIAARYDSDVAVVKTANNLTTDVIWVGKILCIPTPETAGISPSAEQESAAEVVPEPSEELVPPEYVVPTMTQLPPPPDYVPPSVLETGIPELGVVPLAPGAANVVRTEREWVGKHTADFADPDGANAMVVLTWEKKDLPVVIRAQSGFTASGVSAQNFEYSWVPNVPFRDIPAGNYEVWIENEPGQVATAVVKDGQRTIVDFKQQDVIPESVSTATAVTGGWAVDLIENTCGTQAIGGSSVIIARTGADGQIFRVKSPGFETTCATGTKPEYGAGACDVGGLRAGTYQVTVDGSGTWLELYVDGQCNATVEFHPR